MNIERLAWDSDFFGYEVAKVTGFIGSDEQLQTIQNSSFKLFYVFAQAPILQLPSNYFLADEKVVFKKSLIAQRVSSVRTEIKEVKEPSAALLNLALQSGAYSRFKIDPHFVHQEFERLYQQWLINSFDAAKNARVFVYEEETELFGFVTLGIKNGIPDIGLIAVAENTRGKGVGSALLDFVDALLLAENYKELTVTTQGKNLPAMAFYHKNNFEVLTRTYIYHVWK